MKPQRQIRRALGALGLTLGLALTFALAGLAGPAGLPGSAPAGAHDGGGTLTVEQVHPAGTSVHYIVLLTWNNDGHPAEDATVTATPVGPDGAALTPVTLAPSGAGDGRYSGAVEFPSAGAWTVRFTSIDPDGSAERPEQVAEPTTTTVGDAGDAGGSGAGATATGEPGFAPADDGTGGSAAAAGDGDDGGIPVLLIAGAAVVAIGGVVTALLAIRRYRPEPGDLAPAAGAAAPTEAPPEAGTEAASGDEAKGEAATPAGAEGEAASTPSASADKDS